MKEETRFQENNEYRFEISEPTDEDPTLVFCPQCESRAMITLQNNKVTLICSSCSYSKSKIVNGRTYNWSNPTDGYFGLSLWLTTQCVGETLWAFNLRHLKFLENFVSAKHRQRNPSVENWQNSTLGSRLPKWLKLAKNRSNVLKAINILKQKI